MSQAAQQLNYYLPERSNSYWRSPRSVKDIKIAKKDGNGENIVTQDGELVMRSLSFSEIKLIAEAYSFSEMKEKPGEICKRSYDDLQKATGNSRGTVSKAIKTTTKAGVLVQTKHFHEKAEYKCDGFKKDEFYITYEKYLFEREFPIPRENRMRKLKDLEIRLVSTLGAISNSNSGKGCDFSIEELCDEFGTCEDDVRDCLRSMINAGFISCNERIKYRHRAKRCHFNVHTKVRRLMLHAKRQAVPKRGLSGQEIEADKRAEWESYFAQNRNTAIERADYWKDRAMRDEEFRELEEKIAPFEFKKAQAEHKGLHALLDDLQRQEAELRLRRARALVRLNINEQDLEPQWTCSKCEDTGYNVRTGQICDCYKPPGGDP